MGKNIIFLIISTIGFLQSSAQTLSGYIKDAQSGEPLIGANVFETNYKIGANTNAYGFFSLTIPKAKDSVSVRITYVGYATQMLTLAIVDDALVNILLSQGTDLDVVEVTDAKQNAIENQAQMGKVELSITQIEQLPTLLGEADVLKAFQLTPGVQSGVEGSNGLYIRGGSPDQNLILIDGVPVYNVSHLFGLFSVFNTDAIQSATLIKGGLPARYGGRLSGLVDIKMKEGNNQTFHGEGAIGLIFSKLTLEGPIQKGKSSFLLSARRTYIDQLVQPFINGGLKDIRLDLGFYFYDINAKVNHQFNDKNQIFLSFYTGQDVFKTQAKEERATFRQDLESGLNWGNRTAALRYNRIWNKNLFSNLTATYSQFNLNSGYSSNQEPVNNSSVERLQSSYTYLSGIEDVALKLDFDFIPNPTHYIRFGGMAIYHQFQTGAEQIINSNDITLDSLNIQPLKALEANIYIEDEWAINEKLQINAGLHAGIFIVENKQYPTLQPRINVRYLLPNKTALKGSFSTMQQFVHLLTNEGVGLPTDLWVPSTKRIVPETAWQVSAGVAKTIKGLELSLETYYKKMNNLLSYKAAASFLGQNEAADWQDKVVQGEGEAYGLELFAQKKLGKTTGWVGYTLAWNNRLFETLNNGKPYPFKYDRRHDISIVVNHKFSERFRMAATWVYGSGYAVTLPEYQYYIHLPALITRVNQVEVTTEKNNYRIRDYHRLDLNFIFSKTKKWGERQWVFGAYNVYNRANTFYVGQQGLINTRTISYKIAREYALIPIIPFVAYQFKF
jgi:outer membrane receptor for ferrienterochelin and colicin